MQDKNFLRENRESDSDRRGNSITGGDGSIKLNDYSATTFNINDTAYEISGNKLVEKAGE